MSIKINEVAFVGYPVSDIQRARDFYEGILGLAPGEIDHEIDGMPGKFWIEYAVADQTFAISNLWNPSGEGGPAIAFEVEDLDASISHLKDAGVKIVEDCIETPVCRLAVIEDFDGNTITIHKRN